MSNSEGHYLRAGWLIWKSAGTQKDRPIRVFVAIFKMADNFKAHIKSTVGGIRATVSNLVMRIGRFRVKHLMTDVAEAPDYNDHFGGGWFG